MDPIGLMTISVVRSPRSLDGGRNSLQFPQDVKIMVMAAPVIGKVEVPQDVKIMGMAAPIIRKVEVAIVNRTFCAKSYPSNGIDVPLICAGKFKANSCRGDSGVSCSIAPDPLNLGP